MVTVSFLECLWGKLSNTCLRLNDKSAGFPPTQPDAVLREAQVSSLGRGVPFSWPALSRTGGLCPQVETALRTPDSRLSVSAAVTAGGTAYGWLVNTVLFPQATLRVHITQWLRDMLLQWKQLDLLRHVSRDLRNLTRGGGKAAEEEFADRHRKVRAAPRVFT